MKLCSLQPFDLTTFYYFKKGLLLLLQRHYAGGWHKRPPPASTVFVTASIAYTTVLTGVNCYVPAIYFPCVTQIYYDLVSDKNCYGRQRHTYTAYFIQIRPCMYSCNFILWMHTDQEYVRRDTYLHLQIIRRKKFEKKMLMTKDDAPPESKMQVERVSLTYDSRTQESESDIHHFRALLRYSLVPNVAKLATFICNRIYLHEQNFFIK
jgi:hypothetical protein